MKYVWERLVACTTHGRGPVVASVLSQTSRMSDLLLNSCSLFLLFLLKKIIGIQWVIFIDLGHHLRIFHHAELPKDP